MIVNTVIILFIDFKIWTTINRVNVRNIISFGWERSLERYSVFTSSFELIHSITKMIHPIWLVFYDMKSR